MHTKTPIAGAVLVLMASLVPSAPSADLRELKSRGTLKVLATRDEEPAMFNFKAGEPGFERELLEGFARLHRLKFEPVPVARFDELIGMLNRAEGDVIVGIIDNEARRKLVAFTGEVLPARHVAVTWKPRRILATVEEFRAEKVGVIKGTSWATAALSTGIPASRVEDFPDHSSLLAALESGRVTATVMSLSDLTLIMRRQPKLQPGVFVGEALSSAWAVRREDTDLKAVLDEYVDNVRKGQAWSRLVVKYFGEDALKVLKGASGSK